MLKYTGRVTQGKILPYEAPIYFEKIQRLEGYEVSVEVKPLKKRSLKQNRYYWGVVVPMIQHRLSDLGYTRADLIKDQHPTLLLRDDVHDFLKANFNQTEIVDLDGSVIGKTTRPTRDLSSIEFTEYIEVIKRWAAQDLELEIKDPKIDFAI